MADIETAHRAPIPFNNLTHTDRIDETVEIIYAGLELLAGKAGFNADEFIALAAQHATAKKSAAYAAEFEEDRKRKQRQCFDRQHAPGIVAEIITKQSLMVFESGDVLKPEQVKCAICGTAIDWKSFARNNIRQTSIGNREGLRRMYEGELLHGNTRYLWLSCQKPECFGQRGEFRFVGRT